MLKLAIVPRFSSRSHLGIKTEIESLLSRAPGIIDSDMETETDNARLLLGVHRELFHSLCRLLYM